jgi:hypothetical protein
MTAKAVKMCESPKNNRPVFPSGYRLLLAEQQTVCFMLGACLHTRQKFARLLYVSTGFGTIRGGVMGDTKISKSVRCPDLSRKLDKTAWEELMP